MTHVTRRLTAKNRDQLRNATLGNRVWATFQCAENYNKRHNKFIFNTAVSILLISNHISFLVLLFDKVASVENAYILFENIY